MQHLALKVVPATFLLVSFFQVKKRAFVKLGKKNKLFYSFGSLENQTLVFKNSNFSSSEVIWFIFSTIPLTVSKVSSLLNTLLLIGSLMSIKAFH